MCVYWLAESAPDWPIEGCGGAALHAGAGNEPEVSACPANGNCLIRLRMSWGVSKVARFAKSGSPV